MQVIESVEQLSHNLKHFLLLEQSESLLEAEERIFSVLHDKVDMRFACIEVVQFYDVFVFSKGKDFDFPCKVIFDFVAVSDCYRFLSEQHLGVLLLHQVNKRVRSNSNGLDLIEKVCLLALLSWFFLVKHYFGDSGTLG